MSNIRFLYKILSNNRLYYNYYIHKYAELNKVPLTFFDKLPQEIRIKSRRYNYHISRLKRIVELAVDVSNIINLHNMNCIIFKTIPKFRESIADVDVICINNYDKMINILLREGYKTMEKYWYCTTLKDFKTNFLPDPIMVDIYNYITIGGFIYINKNYLYKYIIYDRLSNIAPWIRESFPAYSNRYVFTLDDSMEFVAIVAHSIFKDRTYYLRDYLIIKNYSINYTKKFNKNIEIIVRDNYLLQSLILYLSISYNIALILKDTSVISFIQDILYELNVKKLYKINLTDLPYKYDSNILLKILLEKINDKNAFGSVPLVLSNIRYKNFLLRLFFNMLK